MNSSILSSRAVRTALVGAVASLGIAAAGLMGSQGSAAAQDCVAQCASAPTPIVAPSQVIVDKARPTKAPPKTATVTETLSLSFTKVEFQ